MRQLKKNKELYLECLKEADLEQMNYMMNVDSQRDPKLYKTLQSSAGMRRRDAVIKVLTEEKGPETQTLIDYLYGRVPFSALYPYEEQMAKNSHFTGAIDCVICWTAFLLRMRTGNF